MSSFSIRGEVTSETTERRSGASPNRIAPARNGVDGAGTATAFDVPDAHVKLAALTNLESPETRREFLASHPELVRPEIVEKLAEEVRLLLRTDLDVALRKSDAALAIGEALGAAESIARALRARANVLWSRGKYRPAVDLLNRAANLFTEAGKVDELGRTLSTSIQPLILLGEYDRAHQNAERARGIFTLRQDRLRLARLEINVANIHHRQEQYASALSSYERAYRELCVVEDSEGVAVALHNMAVCLISLNRFDRALEVYQQARSYFELHQMPLLRSQAEYNIAYLFYLRGEYDRAMRGLRTARENCSRNGDGYHTALCDLDLSDIYLELNLTRDAARMAHDAAIRFEQLGNGYEAARALTNLAIAVSRNGETKKAIGLFTRAKEMFANESHKVGESTVDLYKALLLSEAGDVSGAQELCQRASQFFNSAGLARRALLSDLLLARLALANGDLESARSRAQAALQASRGLEAPVLRHYAYMQVGHVAGASCDSAGAFEAYHAARAELETLRSSLQGEELRIAFMRNRLEVYERLTQLCLDRGMNGPAG